VTDRTSAAAASSQGVLCDLGDRHDGGGCIEFYVIQSDPGTILVRGHQRCSGGAGDLTANTKVMGQFTVTGGLRFTGWLATAVMAAAVAGMLITAAM
jgi:hypothetical protein